MTPEELDREIERSKAVTGVAQQVVATANTLRALEFQDGAMNAHTRLPRMLTDGQ